MSKYKSEYTQWFWSECDELNSDTSFANLLAEKAWDYKQAEIDKYKEVAESMEDAYLREKSKVDELRKRIDESLLIVERMAKATNSTAMWAFDLDKTLKGTTNEQ